VFLLAVVVIALSLLFLLTALALGAAHRLHHPYRVGLALASALLIGLAILVEFVAARG
jgi:hypothetical protein